MSLTVNKHPREFLTGIYAFSLIFHSFKKILSSKVLRILHAVTIQNDKI